MKTFFTIESLRCFVTVVKYQNLSIAAKELKKTSPAVSMMLKQFQAGVDRPLFETSRKTALTDFGKYVYHQALEQLNNLEKLSENILSFSRSEFGFLSISMVPSISRFILSGVIWNFLESSPNVHFDISDDDSKTILRRVEKKSLDIGICSAHKPLSETLYSSLLLEDSFGLVCDKEHPILKNRNKLKWEDIEPYPIVNNEVCNKIENPIFKETLSRSQIISRNTRTLLSLIEKSNRITLMPYLNYYFSNSDLVFIPLKDFDVSNQEEANTQGLVRKLQIVIHNDSMSKLLVQKMLKLIKQEIRNNQPINDSPFIKVYC